MIKQETYKYSYICCGSFLFHKLKWEEIVHFVDIGGTVDHHCLNCLFIIHIYISQWSSLQTYDSIPSGLNYRKEYQDSLYTSTFHQLEIFISQFHEHLIFTHFGNYILVLFCSFQTNIGLIKENYFRITVKFDIKIVLSNYWHIFKCTQYI